jgi:DNA-binding response OmpR family regulator
MPAGHKILLLESDPASSFPLSAGLRRTGWIVMSAQDEERAAQLTRKHRPDAVLLNSRFADGRAIATLQRLRSSPATTLTPVLCIAAEGSAERDAFLQSGAHEILVPPPAPEAIDTALRRHLGRPPRMVMVPAPVLQNPARAKAMQDSGLLDRRPDEALDRVTRLAARLLRAPIARLSLVDGERQFFPSQVDAASQKPVHETPLSHSICQWVVGGREEMFVSDTGKDPLLGSSPAVTEDGVGSYAGVPFTMDDCEILGSFCVADSQPHDWSQVDMATLRDLGGLMRAVAVARRADGNAGERLRTAAAGIVAATNVLLRLPPTAEAEGRDVRHIIDELSATITGRERQSVQAL